MTYEDREHVIANLRAADRLEMDRLVGPVAPRVMVEHTCLRATAALAGLWGGEVACIFGINRRSDYGPAIGVPWMLSTPLVESIGWPLVRASREYVDRMVAAFPQQENVCDAENTLTLDWLKWLGFDMDEPKPAGVRGLPFVRFSRGMNVS